MCPQALFRRVVRNFVVPDDTIRAGQFGQTDWPLARPTRPSSVPPPIRLSGICACKGGQQLKCRQRALRPEGISNPARNRIAQTAFAGPVGGRPTIYVQPGLPIPAGWRSASTQAAPGMKLESVRFLLNLPDR